MESFRLHKLTQEEDNTYLMRAAQKLNASGLQKKRKLAQMAADESKAAENVQKEAR